MMDKLEYYNPGIRLIGLLILEKNHDTKIKRLKNKNEY